MVEREKIVGSWFRTDVQLNGETHTELAQIHNDGSYEFSFTIYDNNNLQIQHNIELGDWGLVGDIHFTIAKAEVVDEEAYPMDMANEDNYHAYKVLELNSQQFKYQHIVTKEVFNLKRVIDRIAHC